MFVNHPAAATEQRIRELAARASRREPLFRPGEPGPVPRGGSPLTEEEQPARVRVYRHPHPRKRARTA